MNKIVISNVVDDIFGNCVKMTNGIIELMVTVDFGPRVIHFSTVGRENMFFMDKEKKPLGDFLEIYKGDVHRLYGGHRIWAGPEVMPRCYHPDNLPVACRQVENGMEFTAAVEKENAIQKSMTITLEPDKPFVDISHSIENLGAWEIEFAPWCITMLDKGGKEIMPQPDRKTGYLHNRNFSLWDYSQMNDDRVYWGKEFITIRQDSTKANPFKLGYNNEAGWAAYFNKGQLFFKFFETAIDGLYPDNGCCYETYTNDVMLEVETLGEIQIVAPNETVVHVEQWELYEESAVPSNDENEIKNIISKYIS